VPLWLPPSSAPSWSVNNFRMIGVALLLVLHDIVVVVVGWCCVGKLENLLGASLLAGLDDDDDNVDVVTVAITGEP